MSNDNIKLNLNNPLGLTKREYIAILFTQSFISIEYGSFEICIESGIKTADIFLTQLNKQTKS